MEQAGKISKEQRQQWIEALRSAPWINYGGCSCCELIWGQSHGDKRQTSFDLETKELK